jgi:hypothetical protein
VHRTGLVVAGTAICLLTGAAVAADRSASGSSATVEPVRARPRLDEESPAAGSGAVAWSQNRAPGVGRYDVWARLEGSRAFKVNARGTEGFPGGIDGTTLVFQQSDEARNDSDLWLYDLTTRTRRKLGRQFNTEEWEWAPSLAGGRILFGRGRLQGIFEPGLRQVLLVDRSTGEQRQLAKTETLETEVIPGQLSGDFAVWSVCRARRDATLCDTFLHDVASATTTKLPLGTARSQFAASVTAAGVVYLVRSNGRCGDAAYLVRHSPGAVDETLMRFPRGTESFRSYAFERDTGETEVYFERSRCSSGRSDVVRVIDTH